MTIPAAGSHRARPLPPSLATFFRDEMPRLAGDFLLFDRAPNHNDLVFGAAESRGLTVRRIGGGVYFYDGPTPVGGIVGMVSTVVARSAIRVCQSKTLTKDMLSAAGVPHPTGRLLERSQLDAAVRLVDAAEGPLVLKPDGGYGGAGITCGITSVDDMRAAWDYAIRHGKPEVPFVVEHQVEGFDIRAFVVGSRVVAAAVRLPAHVVGDGHSTIAALFDEKQTLRAKHADMAIVPLILDEDFLVRTGWSSAHVPGAGDVVLLNDVANVSRGGDCVDVTDAMHPDLVELAVRAVQSIPGLNVAGVDILTPSLASADEAAVVEVNVRADVGVHHHPSYGQPRDAAGALVDYLVAVSERERSQ